ncbi:low-density lipoprotein receptor repeat domain-containing protein cueball isoform X2 [Anticarsia gemmatalis]|uniref:low-density lipoprotein receptor repeat domain-containing protein cueball isoform X2 n=1 Tax=Anticarsia gemmatalis TaxID=129554 RepID=UPI003F758FFC
MMRIQCLLAFAALSVGLAHSWDVAITVGDKLEFYNGNSKTLGEGVLLPDSELSPLTYDGVHNKLFFAAKKDTITSIYSYDLETKERVLLVTRTEDEKILGFAYDPVDEVLFWTSTDKNIYWVSNNGSNGIFKNLTSNEIPSGIAVDSCRRYIYWINSNNMKPSINRARFDGTESQAIVETNMYIPVSIAIDQQTNKIYWTDDKQGMHYSIDMANLDGQNSTSLIHGSDKQEPIALTVSNDSIYWMDKYHDVIWRLSKKNKAAPEEYIKFTNQKGFGIVANYRIEDQIRGQEECEPVRRLLRSNSVPKDSMTEASANASCNCSPDHITERIASTVCLNYCLHGGCTVTLEDTPKCSCDPGYAGVRCEIAVCAGHCLNNGSCWFNERNEPICECHKEFEGLRCETRKVIPIISNETTAPACNCTETQKAIAAPPLATAPENGTQFEDNPEAFKQNVDDIIATCSGGWDPVRDPVIMALGVLVGVLCLFCGLLVTKVLQLKRRPRIKKRIIVNKNVTPMTARPDQCEITIENCCNMNICETDDNASKSSAMSLGI